MTNSREDLRRLLGELGVQARLLKEFGVREVAPRQPARPVAPPAAAEEIEAAGAPAYAFGEGRRARWEQGMKERLDRGKKPAPGPDREPGRGQSTLFGGAQRPGDGTAAAPAPAARWRPNPRTATEAQEQLAQIRREIGDCTRCRLHTGRRQIVFGEGHPTARLVFAGEGPGEEEDKTGRPFVGRAGQLLDRMIVAMGLKREDVYICNVVKCRPPGNRTPQDDEMRTCGQFLSRQLAVLGARHIVCLGATAAKYLLNTQAPMGKLRGRFFDDASGARFMATYHPAYLLRNPAAKKQVWEDLQKVMAEMAVPVEP
jgi:DNA polymerase